MFDSRTRMLAGTVTAVICLLLPGPSAPGGAPFARTAPPTAATVPNRVMTWNICNPCGSEHNAGRAAEIARYAPQVIGLQEACVRDVERIRFYLEYRHGLAYHVAYGPVLRNFGRCGGVPWRPGAYGQALLSAAPMTDRSNTEFPDGGSEDRGYLAVTTLVGGRPVRVLNAHLAERSQAPVRAGQTAVLAAALSRHDRAILLGDLNAVPDAPELTRIWPLATDADPRCRPPSQPDCEPTTDWQSKFDYIFLRGLTPLNHTVHPTDHSDHALLRADLTPPRAAASARSKL
ncbi:endonuclease/exonuclease/phosphatase family protein [Streptomyces polyrhachis]|uniref:Endonuclease/exonuclease/phosphatase family protein n=1 Tax=Streptomyces polyrhachis TaxID=1282885 RepID=A0ABW2GCT8_9ACTN